VLAARLATRIAAPLMCVSLLAPACDPTNAVLERFGLIRTTEGVAVRYVLCPDELVTDVSLAESGTAPNRYLWRVESTGEDQSEFIIGRRPDGFVETVSLGSPLSSSNRYVVALDSNDQDIASETFRLSDLKSDAVLVAWKDEYVSSSQFENRGRDIC
jgi:hypothetical protein